MRPELLPLENDEVHLWYLLTDQVSDPDLLERFRATLSRDELARWQRFSFAEGRRQFLVSHGFVRAVLSHYAEVDPAGWHFRHGAYGKPEAVPPPGALPPGRSLCFNLTHTRGLAACIVAWDREVGVDAEDWERQGREVSAELIRRCLSPVELECFQALPPIDRQRCFFDYWTLKEAYLKARGFGLSLPVEEITFHWPSGVPHAGPVAASFGPRINDLPHTWQFERFSPTGRHRVAVAVRRAAVPGLAVVVREYPR